MRKLQTAVAEDITIRVHGQEKLDTAIAASQILFGKSSADDLRKLTEKDFFAIFDGVPTAEVSRADVEAGMNLMDAFVGKTDFLPSNGEVKRGLKENSISVNKEKVNGDFSITKETLINDKYVLLGKGKKNNYILVVK